jgi:hypothetical protein
LYINRCLLFRSSCERRKELTFFNPVQNQKVYRATERTEALACDPATRRHVIHWEVGVTVKELDLWNWWRRSRGGSVRWRWRRRHYIGQRINIGGGGGNKWLRFRVVRVTRRFSGHRRSGGRRAVGGGLAMVGKAEGWGVRGRRPLGMAGTTTATKS